MKSGDWIYRSAIRCIVLGPVLCLAASASGAPRSAAAALLKLLDRPRVPLAAEAALAGNSGGFERRRFSFASESSQRVPGILIKPKDASGPLPAVVVLHGTGGNKTGQEPLLRLFATRGLLAVAIDGRYHGERSKAGSGSADYVEAILRAYRTGKEHPFLYDTVWDVMRLIDYLESRDDVDASRIGLIGFSKGGMETYLAAALDPRIRAAVPCIGVQSFRWGLEHDAWQSRVGTFQAALQTAAFDAGVERVDAAFVRRFYDRAVPGIYSEFDGQAMLPMIAPRPLLVINGDSDPRTPLPGLMECVEAAKKSYAEAGGSAHFQFLLQPDTGHRVGPDARQAAINFLVRHLVRPEAEGPRR